MDSEFLIATLLSCLGLLLAIVGYFLKKLDASIEELKEAIIILKISTATKPDFADVKKEALEVASDVVNKHIIEYHNNR